MPAGPISTSPARPDPTMPATASTWSGPSPAAASSTRSICLAAAGVRRLYHLLTVTRFEDQRSLAMPTIKAIPRGGFWSLLVGDDGRRLDRGMDIRALSDALVGIRSDEQHHWHSSSTHLTDDHALINCYDRLGSRLASKTLGRDRYICTLDT